MRRLTVDQFHEAFGTSEETTKSAAQDNKQQQCCVVIVDGGVYDVTAFLPRHPGGFSLLHNQHGRDVTHQFFDKYRHSDNARKILAKYKVGEIIVSSVATIVDDDVVGESSALLSAKSNKKNVDTAAENIDGQNKQENTATAKRSDESRENTENDTGEDQDEDGTDFVMNFLRQRDAEIRARPYNANSGPAWHDRRRAEILARYPNFQKDIVEKYRYFPPTLLIGILGALLQWQVLSRWIPLIICRVACWSPSSSSAPWSCASYKNIFEAIRDGPVCWCPCLVETVGWFGQVLVILVITFGLAYTVGAACRMVAFACGHELAHETVHPWLSDTAFLFSPQPTSSSSSSSSSSSWSQNIIGAKLRFILKNLALRLTTLPSLGAIVFEYYENQHLSHHKYLGTLQLEESAVSLFDGTSSGDGDQLSVNTLLMKQRGLPVGVFGMGDREKSLQSARPDEIVKDLIKDENMWIRRVVEHHPVLTKLVYDPIFHVMHFAMMMSTSVQVLIAPAWAVMAAAYLFCSSLLPQSVRHRAYDFVLKKMRLHHFSSSSEIRMRVSPQQWKQNKPPITSLESFRMLLVALWPVASAGFQHVLWMMLFVRLYFVDYSDFGGDGGAKNNPVAMYPLTTLVLALFYMALSEMFLFGFLFHPFLVYFLSVHQSAYHHDHDAGNENDDTTKKKEQQQQQQQQNQQQQQQQNQQQQQQQNQQDGDEGENSSFPFSSCQPTRSVYTTWLSIASFNLNYHVEHHDFPSVPWFYLPRIKKAAPDFYDDPKRNAFFTSGFEVVWKYLNDQNTFVYGCADC